MPMAYIPMIVFIKFSHITEFWFVLNNFVYKLFVIVVRLDTVMAKRDPISSSVKRLL